MPESLSFSTLFPHLRISSPSLFMTCSVISHSLTLCWWLGLHAGKKQRLWVTIQVLVVCGRCLADFVVVSWLLFLGSVGQVMGLDRWISISWVRWWHGFGFVMAGGFGSWRLVDFGFWVWDRLWPVGLDRSWVLAWFEVGVAQMVFVCFFFFFGLIWDWRSSDGDFFWLGLRSV